MKESFRRKAKLKTAAQTWKAQGLESVNKHSVIPCLGSWPNSPWLVMRDSASPYGWSQLELSFLLPADQSPYWFQTLWGVPEEPDTLHDASQWSRDGREDQVARGPWFGQSGTFFTPFASNFCCSASNCWLSFWKNTAKEVGAFK